MTRKDAIQELIVEWRDYPYLLGTYDCATMCGAYREKLHGTRGEWPERELSVWAVNRVLGRPKRKVEPYSYYAYGDIVLALHDDKLHLGIDLEYCWLIMVEGIGMRRTLQCERHLRYDP